MKPARTANADNRSWLDGDDASASADKADGPVLKFETSLASPTATFAAAASGSVATSTVATTTKYFSPYVDVTLFTTDVAAMSRASGLTSLTLAFMQTTVDAHGDAVLKNGFPYLSWGGLGANTPKPASTTIRDVKAIEAAGGTVTISLGGASGLDPAVYAAAHNLSAARLQAEYQAVINAYHVTHLDFDIEGLSTVNNFAANQLRDKAIVGLEAKNPGLKVSYTLATTAKGLSTLPAGQATNAANDAAATTAGISNEYGVLQQAVADHVRIDTVNIMAMDYYDGNVKEAAPKGTGLNAMYTNAVTAARGTEKQLTQLGVASTTKIGITPMIGQNDDVHEVFTLADAQRLEAFAASTAWVAGLGEWSLSRDTASTQLRLGAADATYSGVVQTAYQFAHIFDQIKTPATAAHTMLAGADPKFGV